MNVDLGWNRSGGIWDRLIPCLRRYIPKEPEGKRHGREKAGMGHGVNGHSGTGTGTWRVLEDRTMIPNGLGAFTL